METRRLGKTGFNVSVIGFGAWAIGADWGNVDDETSMRALHAAVDAGVTFFDTADVYGDGRSEQLIARLRRERDEQLVVATKLGRRLPVQSVAGYSPENIDSFVARSQKNLETDCLDLVQLHCPPTDLYYHQEVFATMDDLVRAGRIANYGVSVERVEEALKALDYPGVSTIQIIYNIFRQRPEERLFPAVQIADVGIIARVPLASGLLTGRITVDTVFPANDHRSYNRHGEAFDVGETFSGVDMKAGLAALAEIQAVLPEGETLTSLALRFCCSHPAVSTVIPGAKTPAQVRDNASAGDHCTLSEDTLARLHEIYWSCIAPSVHNRW
ncbi:MAG: aldo/keto reductase [Acidimicrobiales bacterium]|jgi:aryl-alcohol dehydrogenase-like predicted oxidoreductase